MIRFNKKQQRGLTLVELMVAMVIGLVLVGGVIQIFVANNQTYRVTDNMSRVQENSRFALDNLGKIIRLAGFKGDTEVSPNTDFISSGIFTNAQTVSGTNGGIGAANTLDPSDDISIRYKGASVGNMTDCVGTNIGQGTASAGVEVVNRYYVQGGSLMCQSSVGGAQPLIDNVASMQILYGMTTDSTAFHDLQAECYISAASIGAGTDCTTLNFAEVVSVRIRLLFSTPDDNLTPDGAAQVVNFDDDGAADTMADRRLYREITTTISLRNKIL